MRRCRFRTVCAPGHTPGKIAHTYTLTGLGAPSEPEFLDLIDTDVRAGATFLVAAELPSCASG